MKKIETVIIVDDSGFMRGRLREILIEMGKYVMGEGVNGKEGVDLYVKYKPDLVFLDINMPELSGRDALLQIKSHNPNANVIMCSVLGAEDIISECIEDGALYYVLKPFVRENVIKLVHQVETMLNTES